MQAKYRLYRLPTTGSMAVGLQLTRQALVCWWQNIAIVLIFRLMVASFLTLVVVSTLYAMLASLQEKTRGFAVRALSPSS